MPCSGTARSDRQACRSKWSRRLNETQVTVLKDPDLREKLAGEAVEPWPMTPDQFGQFIRSEIQRWTALAQARNIKLED